MRRIVRPFVGMLLLFVLSFTGRSQGRLTQDVKLELRGGAESALMDYSVTLSDLGRRGPSHYPHYESGGTFAFRDVPAGDYRMHVYGGSGELLQEEIVRIGTTNSVISVQLPKRESTRPSGERVSVRQLQNPPHRKAVGYFVAAQKYSEAGQFEKAAAELEKAIRLSPDYAVAHTNLAAQHLRLQRFQQAIDESNIAMEIASPNVRDLCNRALGEWGLERYPEAIASAEEALRLNGNWPTAHFIRGSLLAMNPETRPEGIRHLERVADQMPAAAKNLEVAKASPN